MKNKYCCVIICVLIVIMGACSSDKLRNEGTFSNVEDSDEALLSENPLVNALVEVTDLPSPTGILLFTSTPVPINTPMFTSTPIPMSTPTFTSTPIPTNTPTFTSTPIPTNTPTFTSTPIPTNMPTFTSTPIPTNTPVPIVKRTAAEEFVLKSLVGWNLGNSFDSYYGEWSSEDKYNNQETMWGNPRVSSELIHFVKEQGFTAIRIPVTWYYNTYKDSYGNYHVNDRYMNRVREVVDYCYQEGLTVLLNMHHDSGTQTSKVRLGASESEQREIFKYYSDVWTDIADKFKDYDNNLCFEGANEVTTCDTGFTYSDVGCRDMNILNQLFVDTVRATGGNNMERVLCIQTYCALGDDRTLNDFVLPVDPAGQGKLIVQIHNYVYMYDQHVERRLVKMEAFSKKIGAPILLGEAGQGVNWLPGEYEAKSYANLLARSNKLGIACYFWDNGKMSEYGIINRKDFTKSDYAVLKAIQNPVEYESDELVFDKMSQFVWKRLSASSGNLKDDNNWGSITTDFVEIPNGATYMCAVSDHGNREDALITISVKVIAYYDKNKKYISGQSGSGNCGRYKKIPEGAKYIKASLYSPSYPVNEDMYKDYFDSNELYLYIKWIEY